MYLERNMSTNTISTATSSDKQQIIDTLVLAFGADPFERWLYNDPHTYLTNFPIFIDALTTRAFETDNAYYVDNYAGTALWLPPNVHLDEELIIASFELTINRQKQTDIISFIEQMEHYHPHEPHWYLVIIGVDPLKQGQGLGGRLLQHTLSLCDRDRALAYLESTNPKNISLYEHHGFKLLGTIQAGDAPPMFPMLRKPR
jgi:ribosomal protein S18 acetylase RimI-like enzyme